MKKKIICPDPMPKPKKPVYPAFFPPRNLFINETVELRTFGFQLHWRFFLRRFEFIPIFAIMGFALGWAAFNVVWAIRTKNDVAFIRGSGHKLAPYETITAEDRLKLYIVDPKIYKPLLELEEMKRLIGSYKP